MGRMLSVALCTHNPRADYLCETLESLRKQTLPPAQWELLIVDNRSDNGVLDGLAGDGLAPTRKVREEELGLTKARIRAIRETTADWLLFVDDDNVLDVRYLETLLRLISVHPQLGCIGAGRLVPRFEAPPAERLKPYLAMLALREVERSLWSNSPGDHITPWGAGLAASRAVAERFAAEVAESPLRAALGRKGRALDSGEDEEFSHVACSMGLGKGLFPELMIHHLIDARRVELDYLLRMAEGHAFSHSLLEVLHGRAISLPELPSLRGVWRGFAAQGVAGLLAASARWWQHVRQAPCDKQFAVARARGAERARQLVAALPREEARTQTVAEGGRGGATASRAAEDLSPAGA